MPLRRASGPISPHWRATNGSVGSRRPRKKRLGSGASRSASISCAEACAGPAVGPDARTAEGCQQPLIQAGADIDRRSLHQRSMEALSARGGPSCSSRKLWRSLTSDTLVECVVCAVHDVRIPRAITARPSVCVHRVASHLAIISHSSAIL